jgi:CRP-like cAMP-binding protein
MVNFLWENIFQRARQQDPVRRVLRENFIFQNLSDRELKFVEDIIHVRTFRPGEIIFRQDEVGVGMYLIMSGIVDVTINDLGEEYGAEPIPAFVTRLEPGDFFGEIALAEENSRRGANATAHTETVLIGFFKPDLMEILERNPSTGAKVVYRLSEVLARRLKETTAKVSSLRKEVRILRGALRGTPNESP